MRLKIFPTLVLQSTLSLLAATLLLAGPARAQSADSSRPASSPKASATPVTVTVNLLADRHPISPYIYGANFPPSASYIANSGLTLSRWGGNNTSRYNWKKNVTNLDNDWYFENYAWTSTSLAPSSAAFLTNVSKAGASPIMTIPMLSWVAKDGSSNSFSVAKYGKQCSTDQWRPDAGDGILTNCSADLTGNDPKDANVPLNDAPVSGDPSGTVYRSQWVAAIAPKFGAQPHFYDLDNEPDIWSGTHRDVHPTPTGYDELAADIVKEGHALKAYDPLAVRLGPVFCCWWFYWNGANNNDKAAHGGLDFLPWLLNQVLFNDVVAGSRSLDVFDLHAYFNGPSTYGMTTAQVAAAALRETRDWWDPAYVSESGEVDQQWTTSIQPNATVAFVLPRMRALANSIYPGTPLSITEWNGALAGESDFSTALVDADAYGILGQQRVWGASRWVAADPATPAYQSLLLYRNPDGKHNGFQSVSVSAANNADPSLFSAFAATDPAGDTLTLLVVNKDPAHPAAVSFNLAGFTPATMKTYTLSSTKPTSIVAAASQSWSSSQTFAPYSATLIVASGRAPQPVAAEWDLNPDTLLANTSSSVTIAPVITSGTGSVTLTGAAGSGGVTLALTQPKLMPPSSANAAAAVVTIKTPATPGIYSFTVTGKDSGGTIQTQQGWVFATVPATKLTKSGDKQSAPRGSKINLTATFVPGASGASAGGVDLLFTTSAGTLNSRILRTSSNGNATVTLTLPNSPGKVTVTAVGPVFWGTPLATFTATAQ